jgi:hypothetical protein
MQISLPSAGEGDAVVVVAIRRDTDREIRANFDRLQRATVAVVDPGVSF